jgi:GTP-binding protein HflX
VVYAAETPTIKLFYMSKKLPKPTIAPREKAFLVGVDLYQQKTFLPLEDSLTELALLADTSGLEVVGEMTQKLDRPHVKTYIGPGKVDELKLLVEETLSQVVIFDDELHRVTSANYKRSAKTSGAGSQLDPRYLAQHAYQEGMLQVELAQYEYYLPRLTGQWTHLERQAGGGGGRAGSTGGVGLRGPGETQLEVDKRAIRREIAHLKKELEKVSGARVQQESLLINNIAAALAILLLSQFIYRHKHYFTNREKYLF